MSNYVLVDIDGVVADCTHRLPLIKDKKFDEAYAAAEHDLPIVPMIDFLLFGLNISTRVIYITGRNETNRKLTQDWLLRNHCPYDQIGFDKLLMRSEGDRRDDNEVKADLFKSLPEHIRRNVIAVFEDRDRVVQMWRDLGLLCFQPKAGDY